MVIAKINIKGKKFDPSYSNKSKCNCGTCNCNCGSQLININVDEKIAELIK